MGYMWAEFCLLAKLDAPEMFTVSQPFLFYLHSVIPVLYFAWTLLFPCPISAYQAHVHASWTIFQILPPFGIQEWLYFPWTVNDSCILFLQFMRHLTWLLCTLLLYMSSLLVNVHVYLPYTYHLLNKWFLSDRKNSSINWSMMDVRTWHE